MLKGKLFGKMQGSFDSLISWFYFILLICWSEVNIVKRSMLLRADMIWRISQMIFNHHKGEACPWLIVCLVRPSPRSHSMPTGWHHHSHCSASQALSGKKSETTGAIGGPVHQTTSRELFIYPHHHHSNNHHHRHHHNSDNSQCNPQGHHHHIVIIITSSSPSSSPSSRW